LTGFLEGDDVAKDSATAGDGLGRGYAATRATPVPHEPRKTIPATIPVAVTRPRPPARRNAIGIANTIAIESKISPLPSVLGAAELD